MAKTAINHPIFLIVYTNPKNGDLGNGLLFVKDTVENYHVLFNKSTRWVPQTIAKLVNITPLSLWLMVLITIVTRVYKATNITRGSHIVHIYDAIFLGGNTSRGSNYFWYSAEYQGFLNVGRGTSLKHDAWNMNFKLNVVSQYCCTCRVLEFVQPRLMVICAFAVPLFTVLSWVPLHAKWYTLEALGLCLLVLNPTKLFKMVPHCHLQSEAPKR